MVVVHELPERPKVGDRIQLPNGEVVRVRDIGLPLLPPKRVCNDPKCPWHGSLPVRMKLLSVVVKKVGMHKVATVLHEWLHYDRKYKRYARRRKKMHVRVPPCIEVRPGDRVLIAETRPLSKTVAWVVVGKHEDLIKLEHKVERVEVT